MPNRTRRLTTALAMLGLVALGVPACKQGTDVASVPSSPPATAAPSPYDDAAAWICRPNKDDVCDGDLDATVIADDGSSSIERWTPAPDPKADCFFLYPTVSLDSGDNSDLVPGDEEVTAVRSEAARFGSTCRVFAPVYRQVTVPALVRAFADPTLKGPDSLARAATEPGMPLSIAYADVAAAFAHYLAHDAGDRPLVLIGHSQGATLAARLLNEEVLGDPALRARLVSALLIGLPPGDRPDPAATPPCTSDRQTGCFVAYSSFRSTLPPSAATIFARSTDAGACTNPAAPAGGPAPLRPYFVADAETWLPAGSPRITTPFVSTPGLLSGDCVTRGGSAWLEVTVHAGPGPRVDDLTDELGPEWGLHRNDMFLALGDLVAMVTSQVGARSAR